MKNLIKEHFSNSEYEIILGHSMPIEGYDYVQDDIAFYVSQSVFISLFKLFLQNLLSEKNEEEIDFNTYSGVNYIFGDNFGCFEEDDIDEYLEWLNSLPLDSAKLTDKEQKQLTKFLKDLSSDVSNFELDEYEANKDDFGEDEEVEDAINNNSFVIYFQTSEDMYY